MSVSRQEAATRTVTPVQVRRFRFRRHQLDRAPGTASGPTDCAVLDVGVQDTGPDGAAWALVVRGVALTSLAAASDDLALAWTLRGAPHAYRRADLAAVAVATAPFSETDAAKRVFDASKPLAEAGVDVLDALRVVAGHERELSRRPVAKGDVSGALTSLLAPEYLRACRPCDATHVYEQPFRLAALQAGLELEPGTSPPVLHRAKGLRPNRFSTLGGEAEARFDVVRSTLRFWGPATVKEVTTFLDAAHADVRAHWPDDVVEVEVEGVPDRRHLLADDLPALDDAGARTRATDVAVRLLGPYDPFVQGRDRDVLVDDAERRTALWPVLGRPGAVVADGTVIGEWRPTTRGRSFTVRLTPWEQLTKVRRRQVEAEAERLAAFKGLELAAVDVES